MPTDAEDEQAVSKQAVNTVVVRFVNPQRRLLEAVSVTGLGDADVEVAACRYYERGLLLHDGQSRSVHPILCLSAALELENHEIVVVPRQVIGHKRPFDDIGTGLDIFDHATKPDRPVKRVRRPSNL